MRDKRIYVVLLVLALASVAGVSIYSKRSRSAARPRPLLAPQRVTRGQLPPLESTAVGVTLSGTLRQSGEHEYAELIIHNNGDEPIDAFELSAPVSELGGTATIFSVAQDARWPQSPGDQFKILPAAPLIPPHGDKPVSVSLDGVPDGSKLSLTAVALHDGRVLGRNAAAFRRDRALEANKAGHPEELRILDGK